MFKESNLSISLFLTGVDFYDNGVPDFKHVMMGKLMYFIIIYFWKTMYCLLVLETERED